MKINKNKLVVYTALFTDDIDYVYGELPEYDINSNVDFICFTNTPHLKSENWDIRLIETDISSRKQARRCKMLSHEYLPDYDAWIWVDNSCLFKYDPVDLFNYYMKDSDICLHEHCDRTTIFEEAQVIIERELDDPMVVTKQLQRYEKLGYQDQGLFETGILMRRNNNTVTNFNNVWWNEVDNNSIRDQISFPYVLWKFDWIKLNKIKETFVAHQSALKKTQSEHFYTVPRSKIKLT